MNTILSNKKNIALMVVPGLMLMLFVIVLPILLSFFFGMTNWDGMSKFDYVGLKNYKEILTKDPAFRSSLLNALYLALGLILIQHPLGMLFAILLDHIGGKLERVLCVIFFIPCVVSVMVIAKLWLMLYNPTFGLINKLLQLLGLDALAHNWLGDTKTVMPALIVILMYQGLGWCMLYYYAGVKGVPVELYEAARMDGCGFFRMHLTITIPMLKPVIRANVTMAVISSLKQMEIVFMTTHGGPGNRTQFLANYLYKQAFSNNRYGYGSAISAIFVVICIAATLFMQRAIPSEEEADRRLERRAAKKHKKT